MAFGQACLDQSCFMRLAAIITVSLLTCGLRAQSACNQLPGKLPVSASRDLEEDEEFWGVYCEGSPEWSFGEAEAPERKGKALRCSITGGEPYSNAHFYRDLPGDAGARRFEMTIDFFYQPTSTFNNEAGPSVLQGLEFTMNKWNGGWRWEWALQWQNVGAGAPQWCYWDPHQAQKWVPLEIKGPLAGETWHTLVMKGRIKKNQVSFESFKIDGVTHALDLIIQPAAVPNDHNRLAVAVQLDGNATQAPFDLFIDDLELDR